jgi:poly-gamma-glutamate capsule biosynthesis protein CapA/YwtB (metallophosphatase superfamily)
MSEMQGVRGHRATAVTAGVVLVATLSGCLSSAPTPSPVGSTPQPTTTATTAATVPAPTAGASPSPTSPPPETFPLAVVTGLESPRVGITLAELNSIAAKGDLVRPCGLEILTPAGLPNPPPGLMSGSVAPCQAADTIAAGLERDPTEVALLPAGLVQPATRTLPVDGTGPYGLFGADLFGDPAMRARPYPITARIADATRFDAAWTAYDPSQVWTMSSVGGVCSDRGAAWQALELGHGWGWLFDGGSARYAGKPHLDPAPPTGISPHIVVTPVETGHAGAVAQLIRGADLTIADVECPIVPKAAFVPNYGRALTFSISEAVLPLWNDTLGFDVTYMAANHNTDKGRAGVVSSTQLLDKYGIEHTGVGLDLDAAMAPAYVERGGVKVAFVAWNDVPGVRRATADSYGVPWLTKSDIFESVRLARAGGAQLVFCDPQWWGGAEYHSDLRNAQLDQLRWFDEAGCDEVVGAGTHFAGPMLLQTLNGHLGIVMASEGNLVFGQDWWQLTQEGVLMTVAFRGAQLVNVHVYPYVMVKNARSDLTDPAADGHYVMDRMWSNSTVDYLGASTGP